VVKNDDESLIKVSGTQAQSKSTARVGFGLESSPNP
jgi:hypothetical protein